MLNDKIAIVTGGAKGIGYGIVEALAKEGARVVVADLEAAPGEFETIICDVSSREAIESLVAQVKERYGRVDILVNNAGIFPYKAALEMTEADWDKVLDVNLKGSFFLSQAVARVMPEGGKIVNISSIASLVGFENLVHYCASKGGMNGMTRAFALELAPKKINVNVVAPGAIATPGADIDENEAKQFIPMIPAGRIGKPEDIAAATVFLASPGADYITGQVLVVDGGWTLR